jgi:hypothetical protein
VSPNGLLSGVTWFRLLCSWSSSGAELVCVFANSLQVTAMASNNDATGAPAAKEGDNKVTGAPSARASDRSNSNACCGLYKFGGQVHDPEETERALRAVSLPHFKPLYVMLL